MRVWPIAKPVSLIGLTALLLSPGLWLGPSLDSAVFLLAGTRIREGFMPYKDIWDHKPPGTYLLNAVSQLAFPWLDPWLLYWLLTLAFAAAAILVVDRLLERSLSPVAAYLWSLVCLIGIAAHPMALGGGATESFALLPLVAVLAAIAGWQPTWRVSVSIGLLLSVACLMSLQAVPAAAVLFAAAVIRGLDAGPAALLRRIVAVAGGGLVVPLVVAGWLWSGGAAADAVDQVVTYNAAYRDSSEGITTLLPAVLLLLGCLAVPALIQVARMVSRRRAFDRIGWVALAWAVGYSAYLGFQNRLYLHYLILLVPPLVLLAGPGMEWLVTRLRSPDLMAKSAAIGFSVVATAMFAISGLTAAELTGITIGKTGEANAASEATAVWLDANTPSSARVFIWGDDTALYLNAHRTPYDRYVYQFPLVTAGYWSPERTSALLASWVASPPAVIVETPSSVPMFGPSDPNNEDPRSYDTLDSLRDFVRGHYRLAAALGNDAVYLPISAPAAP